MVVFISIARTCWNMQASCWKRSGFPWFYSFTTWFAYVSQHLRLPEGHGAQLEVHERGARRNGGDSCTSCVPSGWAEEAGEERRVACLQCCRDEAGAGCLADCQRWQGEVQSLWTGCRQLLPDGWLSQVVRLRAHQSDQCEQVDGGEVREPGSCQGKLPALGDRVPGRRQVRGWIPQQCIAALRRWDALCIGAESGCESRRSRDGWRTPRVGWHFVQLPYDLRTAWFPGTDVLEVHQSPGRVRNELWSSGKVCGAETLWAHRIQNVRGAEEIEARHQAEDHSFVGEGFVWSMEFKCQIFDFEQWRRQSRWWRTSLQASLRGSLLHCLQPSFGAPTGQRQHSGSGGPFVSKCVEFGAPRFKIHVDN